MTRPAPGEARRYYLRSGFWCSRSRSFSSRLGPAFVIVNRDSTDINMGVDYSLEAKREGDWVALPDCPFFSKAVEVRSGGASSPFRIATCDGTDRVALGKGRYRVFKEFEINGVVAVAGETSDIAADGRLAP